MEFDLNDTQRMMQQAARDYLSEQCPTSRVRKIMAAAECFDPELWRGLAEQGWLGMHLPESVDGLELSAVEVAVVAEEFGRACLPGPFLGHLRGTATLAAVDAKAHAKLLGQAARGEARVAVAEGHESLSSPDGAAGEDCALARTGDRARLSGSVAQATDVLGSDWLVVPVRDSAGAPALALVSSQTTGVSCQAITSLDATRAVCDVRFDAVDLPESHIIARGEAARAALRRGWQLATVALCADLVGGMHWILQTSVEYAQTRKQFGKPIGSFQAIQQQCAEMLLYLESARSATWHAAWALSAELPGSEVAQAVSVAKAYASSAAREVANRGVQVHGGIGFTWEHDLQLYYKRATSGALLLGDSAWHHEQLATALWDEG